MATKITIIGAGPGGYETAVEAAARGIEVTIVSDGPVGGTCLNEGCIPTKSFCRNAAFIDDLAKAGTFGVSELDYKFDFSKVLERKNAVVEQLRGGVEFLLGQKLITLVRGKASLKDAHTVVVDGVEYSSDYIIVATGSESASLPIPGADLPGVITSREILDIPAVPESLCVIGGGVIGLEFASIFRSFGSEVTVVEFCKDILPRFDSDIAKRLKQSLSKRGISINTSAQVTGIVQNGDKLVVGYMQKDKEFSISADKVLMAVGRRPALGSLDFDAIGIEYDRRGVKVNEFMQTSVPSVYAIGDITGGMMLAHAATFQGFRALHHILAGQPSSGKVDDIRLDVVPAAVFTSPEAAMVGLTEAECETSGIAVRCLKSFFRANGKAVSMDETDGFVKLVVSEGDGRILGCHMFGPHSADIIQEVTALICHEATVEDFRAIIHAHPTLGEVLQAAVMSDKG